jgi:hypothetical protein
MKSLRRNCRGMVWSGIFLLAGMLSCSKSGSDYEGELYIKLVDAPATYESIHLLIQYVSIHRQGFAFADNLGWRVVNMGDEGEFDVLQLRNGNERSLVFSKVPVDKYDKIKLHFGFCSVKVDGQEYKLTDSTDSFIDYAFEIIEGKRLDLTFDFDVYRSVTPAGNHYSLNPRFRIQQTDLSGSITGSVVDTSAPPIPIEAIISTNTGLDSVVTTNDPSTGSFQLTDLPEKTGSSYDVTIVPVDTTIWRDTTVTGISVYRKQTTSIGTIVLRHR